MPRLTQILLSKKPIKKFSNYRKVDTYKQLRPAVLKNEVSNKGAGRKVRPCLQEMSQMLVCLRNNDFNEPACSKEVSNFWNCQQEFENARKARQEAETKGIMTSETGKLSTKQVNSFMEKWPQNNGDTPITR